MNTAAIADGGGIASAAQPDNRSAPAPGKTVPASGNGRPRAAPAPADLSRMVEALNEFLARSQRSLVFRYDAESGRTIITVIDPSTNDIVRQIPPDELLALARALAAGQAGLFDHYA